jgi:hypothetical protein
MSGAHSRGESNVVGLLSQVGRAQALKGNFRGPSPSANLVGVSGRNQGLKYPYSKGPGPQVRRSLNGCASWPSSVGRLFASIRRGNSSCYI